MFVWVEQNNTRHKIENTEDKCDKQNRKKQQQHRNNNRAINVVQFINRLEKNKIQKLNTKIRLKKINNRNQTPEIRHRLMKSLQSKASRRRNLTCIGTRIEQTAYITRLDKQHTQVINLRGGL